MLSELPAGACDCHAHVFGPLDRFPFIAERSYTPAQTLPSDYGEMLRSIGLTRVVVVQPSVFGADNAATLNAVKELGPNFAASQCFGRRSATASSPTSRRPTSAAFGSPTSRQAACRSPNWRRWRRASGKRLAHPDLRQLLHGP